MIVCACTATHTIIIMTTVIAFLIIIVVFPYPTAKVRNKFDTAKIFSLFSQMPSG